MSNTSFDMVHGPTSAELFVRLATLLNDFNPAHYDLTFAQNAGLPGVIAPGTLLQGWILSDLEEYSAGSLKPPWKPHGLREVDLHLRASFGIGDCVQLHYEWLSDIAVDITATLVEGSRGEPGTVVATATATIEGAG